MQTVQRTFAGGQVLPGLDPKGQKQKKQKTKQKKENKMKYKLKCSQGRQIGGGGASAATVPHSLVGEASIPRFVHHLSGGAHDYHQV